MAHIEKIKRAAVGQMVAHTRRLRLDGRYRNENIDPDRTRLNYRLGGVEDITSKIGMVARSTPSGKLRKDAVAMFSVCNTLPRDWPAERDPRDYFEACHDFNVDFFGCASLGMDVHMDETTPHGHDLFCPQTEDGRVCYADVVPRRKYQAYHQELRAYVKDRLGLDLAITLDESEKAMKALSSADQESYKALVEEAKAADEKAARSESRQRVAAREAAQSQREAEEAARKADEARKAAEAAKAAQIAAEVLRDRALRARDIVEGEKRYRVNGIEHLGLKALAEERDRAEAEVAGLRAERDSLRVEVSEVRLQLDAERSRLVELQAKVGRLRQYVREFLEDVWAQVCEAWSDHGPWREERDESELSRAIDEVSRSWGVHSR